MIEGKTERTLNRRIEFRARVKEITRALPLMHRTERGRRPRLLRFGLIQENDLLEWVVECHRATSLWTWLRHSPAGFRQASAPLNSVMNIAKTFFLEKGNYWILFLKCWTESAISLIKVGKTCDFWVRIVDSRFFSRSSNIFQSFLWNTICFTCFNKL